MPVRVYASDEEYSPLTPPTSPVEASEQPPTPAPVSAAEPEQPPAPVPAPAADEESEPEEDFPVSLSQPPPASPEPKRCQLEPIDDSIVYGNVMHVRSSSSSQQWEWLLDTIGGWVHEERVPPPFSYLLDPSTPTLASLGYPLEQAFATLVAKRDRELRHMREAAGEINLISNTQERIKTRTESVVESLRETDRYHNRLVQEVTALRTQLQTVTTRRNDVEAIAAAAVATASEAMEMVEAAVEDAVQQAAEAEEEPAEEQGSQSTVSSAHSAN